MCGWMCGCVGIGVPIVVDAVGYGKGLWLYILPFSLTPPLTQHAQIQTHMHIYTDTRTYTQTHSLTHAVASCRLVACHKHRPNADADDGGHPGLLR